MKTTTFMLSLILGSTLLQPTLGQELIDLDRARDAGLVTQAEYEQARQRLLDGRPH